MQLKIKPVNTPDVALFCELHGSEPIELCGVVVARIYFSFLIDSRCENITHSVRRVNCKIVKTNISIVINHALLRRTNHYLDLQIFNKSELKFGNERIFFLRIKYLVLYDKNVLILNYNIQACVIYKTSITKYIPTTFSSTLKTPVKTNSNITITI